MAGRGTPLTRSQAVSESHPPTLTQGRRVRSLGAALAGGSPQSSPSPSSSDRLSPLGRPFQESELITPLSQQAASSQGASSSNPIELASGGRSASLPLGFLDEVDEGASPSPHIAMDVDPESAMTRELAKALKDIAACLPIPRDGVERVIDEAKVKIHC